MQPLHFTIYDSQLRKTLKKFCTQPQQRGIWTQPFHCDLQRLSCKTQLNAYAQRLHKLQNRISTPKRKNDDFEAPKENHQHQNGKKPATKAPFATVTQPLQYDLRQRLAKENQNRKTVLENKYPSRSLGEAIPLRPAQTELQNTKEVQHTTVEHIALMHQFQCTKYLNTCKTQ